MRYWQHTETEFVCYVVAHKTFFLVADVPTVYASVALSEGLLVLKTAYCTEIQQNTYSVTFRFLKAIFNKIVPT